MDKSILIDIAIIVCVNLPRFREAFIDLLAGIFLGSLFNNTSNVSPLLITLPILFLENAQYGIVFVSDLFDIDRAQFSHHKVTPFHNKRLCPSKVLLIRYDVGNKETTHHAMTQIGKSMSHLK